MIQESQIDMIRKEYFDWMYHLVGNDNKTRNKISYYKLLNFLDSVIFVPILDMDDNRRVDGVDFRYRFGYEVGYPDSFIDIHMGQEDCSVLEMMVAMACRVEESITDDYLFGNRTGQWFWSMIVSLGLNKMTDDNFDLDYCEEVIDRFLNRKYDYNGNGGLFTLQNPYRDMRDVDIWCQFMWYLDENLKEDNL